ncbi:MAG: phosphatidylinositol-specific phospholipase C domain-containing protein [Bacteroidales bacterium]
MKKRISYGWGVARAGAVFSLLIVLVLFSGCKKDFLKEPNAYQQVNTEQTLKNTGVQSSYKDVQFGLSTNYDTGDHVSVAINKQGRLVEVHKSHTLLDVWYRVGSYVNNEIHWQIPHKYDSGINPSVDMNDNNVIVEVHETQSPFTSGIFYRVGEHNSDDLSWNASSKYDNGSKPDVAVNNNNVVVEVHKSQSNFGLFYHVGIVDPQNRTISWGGSHKYDGGGDNPSVTINDNNQVVEVHQAPTSGRIWYRVGTINVANKDIQWGPSTDYDSGSAPNVDLLNNGYLVEVHRSEGAKDNLWSRVGEIQGNQIHWYRNAEYFDNGKDPSVSINDNVAVQVHTASTTFGIWSSSSLITDRANWMYNNMAFIGKKTLCQITIPGSHDAGMYPGSLAQTQDKNFYQQLYAGSRYFDLRPDGNLHVYHGPVGGPSLDEIFSDIRKYMDEGHHELILLKFSHFKDIDSQKYNELVQKIKDHLGSYLYIPKNADQRIADTPLEDVIGDGGKVLILMDGGYAKNNRDEGIIDYCDNYGASPKDAQFTLYDSYSNTKDYDKMRSDQLNKYYNFTGVAKDGGCSDLFLLSWTLTPVTDVAKYSKPANGRLYHEMQAIMPNSSGKVPNILYVDYMQLSRATDAAITMNQRF